MAKGKRALFEVLQKDKRFQRQPTASPVSPAPIAPAAPVMRPAAVAPPPTVVIKKIKPPGPTLKERVRKAYREARARLQPGIDHWRPRVIEHGGVIVGVLAAFTMIGIVELVRRAEHPATVQPAAVASIDELRSQSAHPSVLQIDQTTVAPTQVAVAPSAPDAPDAPDAPAAPAVAPGSDDADLSADAATARPASSVFTPTARQVNLNYVLVQSYGDQKTAQEAVDFLNNGGVSCTIERGIDHWRKDFYLVIGLQGFPRVSGTEYEAYRQKIDALSAQFAPPHSYKRFDPIAIKWDKTE